MHIMQPSVNNVLGFIVSCDKFYVQTSVKIIMTVVKSMLACVLLVLASSFYCSAQGVYLYERWEKSIVDHNPTVVHSEFAKSGNMIVTLVKEDRNSNKQHQYVLYLIHTQSAETIARIELPEIDYEETPEPAYMQMHVCEKDDLVVLLQHDIGLLDLNTLEVTYTPFDSPFEYGVGRMFTCNADGSEMYVRSQNSFYAVSTSNSEYEFLFRVDEEFPFGYMFEQEVKSLNRMYIKNHKDSAYYYYDFTTRTSHECSEKIASLLSYCVSTTNLFTLESKSVDTLGKRVFVQEREPDDLTLVREWQINFGTDNVNEMWPNVTPDLRHAYVFGLLFNLETKKFVSTEQSNVYYQKFDPSGNYYLATSGNKLTLYDLDERIADIEDVGIRTSLNNVLNVQFVDETQIQLATENVLNNSVDVSLLDITGKIVAKQQVDVHTHSEGSHVQVALPSTVVPGVYMVSLMDGDGQVYVGTFLK